MQVAVADTQVAVADTQVAVADTQVAVADTQVAGGTQEKHERVGHGLALGVSVAVG
jgi:hypothetical protein